MPAIHQLVAGFVDGDAISNEARVMRDIFKTWGYEAHIYSDPKCIPTELRNECGDVGELARVIKPDDIAFLHLSIGSTVNDIFPTLNCRKVILYHNVTPPEFFIGFDQHAVHMLTRGREQVAQLAGSADVVLADSGYNAKELEPLGYKDVRVLPLVLNLNKLTDQIDGRTLRGFDDGRTNILFVGRCVPNKRLEDALSAFYYFQKFVEPNSRFIHVGSFAGTMAYHAMLVAHARDLHLNNVEFVGSARQTELNAAYKAAHLFLCMSEHEGFCIPLMESMLMDVPVLAYEAAAVPETLDGAGVLFSEKRFDLVAEMMGRIAHDQPLRQSLIDGQRVRLDRYRNRDLTAELRDHLAPLLKP